MNIASIEPLLRQYGVTAGQIRDLRLAAAALPPELLQRPLFDTPPLPRLNMADSELLLARLLRGMARALGLAVSGPDPLDAAGCPGAEQLLAAAERRRSAGPAPAGGWGRRADDAARRNGPAERV